MNIIAEQIFFGAIIELISLLLSYIFKDKPRTAILIFALGTLFAGFVAFGPSRPPEGSGGFPTPASTSPSDNEAAIPPSAALTFSENFEDGSADGFTYQSGNWIVVSEANGNKILDINSMDTSADNPSIAFGEASWENFVFESRIRIVDYGPSNDAPLASIYFRGNYRVAFTPYWKAFDLVYAPSWNIISGITFDTQKNIWYVVRVEAHDSKLDVFLNDMLVMSNTVSQQSSGPFGFEIISKAHVQLDDIIVNH
jgi:hypothetical protein